MTATVDRVSDLEILSQMRELGIRAPRANDLHRSITQGRLSVRDGLYYLLLELAEEKRQAQKYGGVLSQSAPAYGE